MRTTYKCQLTFDVLYFSADFGEASSQITYLDAEDKDTASPFQVADARHDPIRAAEMLIEWLGRSYWHDPMAEDNDGNDTDAPENYIVSVEPIE